MALYSYVDFTKLQEKAFFMIKMTNLRQENHKTAAELIVSSMKAFNAFKKKDESELKNADFAFKVLHLRKKFRLYKSTQKQIKMLRCEYPSRDLLIMENDLSKNELRRARNRQVDILT